MKTRQLGMFFLVAAFALAATPSVWAITPFQQPVDASEDMEHDTDVYLPPDFNPLGDPLLAGETPGAQAAHLGGPPDNIAGQDWFDIRNGGVGVIEELPSGFGGIAAPVGSYNGHVPTPHSAGNYAIVQFEGGDGPFGRTNRQTSTNPAPTGGPGGRTGYWATMDLYIDPTRLPNTNGIPDFWFTNAVNGTPASPAAGGYLSESGMTGTVDPAGLTWSIHTTNGVLMATVPVGTWIGYEMEPILSTLNPGLVAFEHRVYADGGTHLVQIGGTVVEDYVAGGLGNFAQLSGPRYNWYTFPEANMPYVLVDNVGWTAIPEPTTTVLFGMGVIGMVAAYRRRRRNG